MEGSRQVLVKVMLFQLREHVHPQDSATPSFFNESRGSLLVLSIDVSFVSKFFWKGDKNFKYLISGRIYMEDPVWKTNFYKSFVYSYPRKTLFQWSFCFLNRFRSIVKIQLFLREMLLKSYMQGTWIWKGKVIAVGQTYFHEALYLYHSIRNFHGTSCNWRYTLDIVCPKDFKQNWKYFQKHLWGERAYIRGPKHIFFKF